MGIFKKVLVSGISVVFLGGIATGIGIGISSYKNSLNTKRNPSNIPEIIPNENEFSSSETSNNLKKLLLEIKPENIVVKKQNSSSEESNNELLDRSDIYAFDIKTKQLEIDTKTKKLIPLNTNITVELDESANNSVDLNEGKLHIVIKASNSFNQTEESKLELAGFNKPTQALKSFITNTNEQDNGTKITTLNLTEPKNSNNSIPFKTIEALNKVQSEPISRSNINDHLKTNVSKGLTDLFKTVNKPMETDDNTRSISIIGQVKLDKIDKKKKTNETLFHLVSATKDQLKLIDTKMQDKLDVALVDEIVVTNLLATSVKFDFNNFEEKDQAEFVKKYVSEATNKGFTASENSVSLKVDKKPPMAEKEISVGINPVLVRRIAEKHEIKANLIVTYGTESLAKTYSTAVNEGFKELTDAGIKFSIYSKKLEDVTETVEASKIKTEANKLSIFFDKDSVSTGVASTSLETDGTGMKKPIGEFILLASGDEGFKKNFTLGTVTSTMEAAHLQEEAQEGLQLDTRQKKWVSENWISFVGYSFGKDLKDKVLFIPTINLIHVAELKTQNMK